MARDCGFGSDGRKKRIDLKHPTPSILSLSLSLISMASIAACIVRIEKLIFRRHG